MLRCTGTVVRTEVREGTSAKTGNAYRFETARVLVGKADFVDVTLPDNVHLRDDDQVDMACIVEARGNQVNVRVRGNWFDLVPAVDTAKLKTA